MQERGIEITLTDDARTLIGNLGYDPTYGARPLKRVIQKRLIDKLALSILEGEFLEGDTVVVDAADGELTFARPASASPRRSERVPPAGGDLPQRVPEESRLRPPVFGAALVVSATPCRRASSAMRGRWYGEETATAPSIRSRRSVAIVPRVLVPLSSSSIAAAGTPRPHELVADGLGLRPAPARVAAAGEDARGHARAVERRALVGARAQLGPRAPRIGLAPEHDDERAPARAPRRRGPRQKRSHVTATPTARSPIG